METNKVINSDKSLSYKNTDPFFIDYYKYRNEVINAKAGVLTGDRVEVLLALSKFLDCVSEYVFDYDIKVKILENLYITHKNLENDQFREALNNIWKSINKDNVAFEILPKPITEQDDFQVLWRNEEHKAIKEVAKAISDIMGNWKK